MKINLFFFVMLSLVSGCQNLIRSPNKMDDQEYTYLKLNNYNGLLKLYRERLVKKEDPDIRLKVAEYYYLLQDFESSRHFLKPLLSTSPSSAAYLLESKNQLDLGQLEEASQSIDKAIALSDSDGEVYNIRGIILAEQGYFDEAISSFNKARTKMIDDNLVMNNIAMIYMLKEQYSQALSYLMPMYNRGDKSTTLIHNLIITLIKLHDYQGAEKIIREEGITQSLEQLVTEINGMQSAVKEKQYPSHGNNNRMTIDQVTTKTSLTEQVLEYPKNNPLLINNRELIPILEDNSSAVTQKQNENNTEIKTAKIEQPNKGEKAEDHQRKNTTAVIMAEATEAKQASRQNGQPDHAQEKRANLAEKVKNDIEKNDKIISPSTIAIISDVRMGDNDKGSRLVIEANKEIKFNLLTSENKNQLTIELKQVKVSELLNHTENYLYKNHAIVESIKVNNKKDDNIIVTFTLKPDIKTKVYRMKPEKHYLDRIVIDFLN